MKSTLEQVKEFHLKFGHLVSDRPQLMIPDINALRVSLLREEVMELAEALLKQDTVEVLDALCDIQYVLDGAFLALGYHSVKELAFAEVHRSNMSKLNENGKPIYRADGKIMKGPNYSPPNLEQFIEAPELCQTCDQCGGTLFNCKCR